jgi:hypothetical protein
MIVPDLRQKTTPVRHYDEPVIERVLSMTDPKNTNQTKLFLQRIRLRGIDRDIVRARAQVDDGASKNCIAKK